MIAATLIALVTHLQVLPALSQSYDVNGGLLYVEPDPNTRYSVKVTYSDIKGVKVQLGARWKF